MADLHKGFEASVSQSFSEIELGDFQQIAKAIWHESYTPKVKHLNAQQKRRAGYLIDRLMRYNCLSKSRKLELQQIKQQLYAELSPVALAPTTPVEPLARTWGLAEDINHLIPGVLQYQTRHYVHSASA